MARQIPYVSHGVLDLIASGLSNREIANRLFVEVSTVKSYTNSIFRKLGVQSRTQAVARTPSIVCCYSCPTRTWAYLWSTTARVVAT